MMVYLAMACNKEFHFVPFLISQQHCVHAYLCVCASLMLENYYIENNN